MIDTSFFHQQKSPLGKKLLLAIIVSSTIVTFFIIAMQLFFDYKTDVQNIENRIVQIQKSYTKSLALSVWNFNKNQYATQLSEILNLGDIVYVEILTPENKKIISKGISQTNRIIKKEFVLHTIDFNEEVISGKLIVIASLQRVYDDLMNKLFMILLTQGIKTLLISLVILYAFYMLVTRHLYSLSNFAKDIDLDSNEEFRLDRKDVTSNDELDYIVTAFNSMQKKIKKDYHKLRQQKELYDLVFEKSSNGVLMLDIDTSKFTQCNNRIVEMLKVDSKDAVLQMTPAQFSPQFQPDGQESEKKSQEMIQIAIDKGTNTFEWKHKRSDGEEFWAEIILTRLTLGDSHKLYVTWKDIDDEKKNHLELQKSQYKLQQLNTTLEDRVKQRTSEIEEISSNFEYLFNNTIEAVGLFRDTICIDINEAGVKLFKFKTKEDALGLTSLDFIADDSIEFVKSKMYENHTKPYETNALKADGTIFPILIKAYNSTIQDKPTRIVSAIDISELKAKELELQNLNKELTNLTNIDPLTGAHNRRYFYEISKQLIALAGRDKQHLSVAMIDIDDFKNVNDTYGHDVGDKVLKALVDIVYTNIRNSDLVIRFGGEEFVLLFPNTGLKEASSIMSKIRQIVEQHDLVKNVFFTISIGISEYHHNEKNIDKAVKRADNSLYVAKNNGKNRVEVS